MPQLCGEVQRSALRSVFSTYSVGSRDQTEAIRIAQRKPCHSPPPKILCSPYLYLACNFFGGELISILTELLEESARFCCPRVLTTSAQYISPGLQVIIIFLFCFGLVRELIFLILSLCKIRKDLF